MISEDIWLSVLVLVRAFAILVFFFCTLSVSCAGAQYMFMFKSASMVRHCTADYWHTYYSVLSYINVRMHREDLSGFSDS